MIVLNNVLTIMEAAAAVAVAIVVAEVSLCCVQKMIYTLIIFKVVVAVAQVLAIVAQNQVILHVIVLNLIHVVVKAAGQEINKVEMMMKIR